MLTFELVVHTEGDELVVETEDDGGTGLIDALGEIQLVELVQDVVGVSHEMLVDQVQEVVLCGVLNLGVVLGLASSDELLSHEVVKVNFDGAGHSFLAHGWASVPKEIEVLHTTDGLKVLHDALADDVPLL